MPYSISGVFNPLITFIDDTPATAEDQNSQDVDIAGGLTQCLTRDGLAPATASISLGGFLLNNVGAGVASTDAANVGQISSANPAGEIIAFAGSGVPAGFLACNGAAVSRTTYAAMFANIGVLWGSGNGTTTFNVPNLAGTVLGGVDPGSTVLASFTTVGNAVGAATVALTTGQLAAHNHGVTDTGHVHGVTDTGHVHTPNSPNTGYFENGTGGTGGGSSGSQFVSAPTTASATTGVIVNSATTGITTQNAGSGSAHPNVQPTAAVNFLIRI